MIPNEQRVRRFLGYFLPEKGYFEGEIDVTYIPLEALKEIFRPEPDDPLMYYCYDVDDDQAKALQRYLDQSLDTTRYKYQLQAESMG